MSEDRDLQEAVLAEFAWEPSITPGHIGVTAEAGVITLIGTVPHYVQKQAAEAAASRVKGVKAVADELKVQLHGSMQRNDTDIARAAVDRLLWESSVPEDAIKVKVDEGWVTLTGEVEWHFQRDAAERMIHGLLGVIGISNFIAIKVHLNTSDLEQRINAALHRSWCDAHAITVSAYGGKVKLTGTVRSLNERWTAGRTAWAAHGVTEVENNLIVDG